MLHRPKILSPFPSDSYFCTAACPEPQRLNWASCHIGSLWQNKEKIPLGLLWSLPADITTVTVVREDTSGVYVQQYGQHVSRAECLVEFESYAAVF